MLPMIPMLRYAFLVLVVAQAGCAATPMIECTNEEKRNWHATNISTILKHVKYPAKAKRIKQEGNVLVALSISEDGSAKSSIKQSSGSASLDAEALRIEEIKYSPPVCSGQKASMTVDIRINFKFHE